MRRAAVVVIVVGATATVVGLAMPVGSAALTVRATSPPPPVASSRAIQAHPPTSKLIPGTHCRAFPASNVLHADISQLPRHPKTSQWMANSQASGRNLHPDFGPSYGDIPVPYGIPITFADARTPRVKVRFGYSDESDRTKYPLGAATKIEGGKNADGDRHAIVIYKPTCTLYETWDTHKRSNGWYAGSGAVWSLKPTRLRPDGWPSADAAGLPIMAGLLRWDEVTAGKVDHAIRFTLPVTRDSYVWPARHKAGSTDSSNYAPMGARFRLKSSFSIGGFSAHTTVILTAMKRQGMILADNGSPWFFQGTADRHWPGSMMDELKRVPASAFEAVDASSLRISANSARSKP